MYDQPVTIKGKKKTSDIIQVDFQTNQGKARGRYFPFLNEDSPIGQLVIAVHGVIPNYIDDIEDFLLDEEVQIDVKHNKSKETEYGR